MEKENDKTESVEPIGVLRKRRELMADGKRYIIYYTFSEDENRSNDEVIEDV